MNGEGSNTYAPWITMHDTPTLIPTVGSIAVPPTTPKGTTMHPEVCPNCGNRDRDTLTCDGTTHRCLRFCICGARFATVTELTEHGAAAVLADLREAGELRTLEQVGWARPRNDGEREFFQWGLVTRREPYGGEFVPVYIVREAEG